MNTIEPFIILYSQNTYLTLDTYSAELVSTLITTPICINNGTLTNAPVIK